MTLDLLAVGTPNGGVLRVAKIERPPKDADAEKPGRRPAGDRSPSPGNHRDRSFNPFAEALLAAQETELERRIAGTLGPAESRRGLGAHIDIFA